MKSGRDTTRGGPFSSAAVRERLAMATRDLRACRGATAVEVVPGVPLRGQAVVVQPHRIEDVADAHALIAYDDAGLGVAGDMPDVQRPRHRRWRRIDDE